MASDSLIPDLIARQKFAVARHLVACYHASRAGLKELQIIRSDRNIQGELAEWVAAQHFGLTLSTSQVQKHVDAVDPVTNDRYQIKARVVKSLSESTSFDFRSVRSSSLSASSSTRHSMSWR